MPYYQFTIMNIQERKNSWSKGASIFSGQILRRKSKVARFKEELGSRSLILPLSVWLIVFYVFVGNTCFNIAYDVASYILTETNQHELCFSVGTSQKTIIPSFIQFTMMNALLFCLYPLVGWLADTAIGYDMSVNISLWFCWIGSVLQCINYSVRYSVGECEVPNAFKYTLSLVTFTLSSIGSTGLYTVLPAYGMGQLADHPTSSIRAFIHWYVMGIFISSLSGMGFISLEWSLVCCSCAALSSSIAICLHGWCYTRFEKIGTQVKNPYKTIFAVLKYACTHSEMGNRSAFTYWEESIPSRIDLGRTKYGGPFEDCDVEDVKRFWRILCLTLCTFGFYISYYATVYKAGAFVGSNLGFYQWGALDNGIIFIIPVLELIIIPCWPKLEYFLLSPLKGIGFSYVLNIIALMAMFIIEIFYSDYSTEKALWFNVPFVLSGLVHGFSFIYGIQFVCSQAPSNMRGVLIGVFWFFHAFFINIGCFFFLLHIPVKWIFLLLLIMSCFGLVVFVVAARWYKRERYQAVYDPYSKISSIYARTNEEIQS